MNLTLNDKTNHIIITSQAAAAVIALGEVQKADSGARLAKKLSFTEQLVMIPSGFSAFSEAFKQTGSVFVRHMFPVTFFDWKREDFNVFLENMDITLPFAIQARGGDFDTAALEAFLENEGFLHDHKFLKQVVSLFFDGNDAYAGLSEVGDNISSHNGGARRFKKDDEIISRAEFKLLEAIESFGITFEESGNSLDLGASPGGFCRVLLERGQLVTAVDPAELDEKLRPDIKSEKLTHYKCLAEKFKGSEGFFDFMTNDMKMDVSDSVKIMLEMSRYLKTGGKALMVLKLSDGSWLKKTNTALKTLRSVYKVENVRQLFNNRSEVTVLLST